ncbi:histidine phosphatase family protein, partial [Streptomyces sp. T-3]|nr:histidine phosphatase family protein [Streptomyces sp. T-3]
MHMKMRAGRTEPGLDRRAFSSLLAAGALTTLPACTRDKSAVYVPPRPANDLTVMVIRHAEKPDADHPGIDERLRPDPKSLTARGWDRARK